MATFDVQLNKNILSICSMGPFKRYVTLFWPILDPPLPCAPPCVIWWHRLRPLPSPVWRDNFQVTFRLTAPPPVSFTDTVATPLPHGSPLECNVLFEWPLHTQKGFRKSHLSSFSDFLSLQIEVRRMFKVLFFLLTISDSVHSSSKGKLFQRVKIDALSWCQFHQRYTYKFFVRTLFF